MSRISIPSLDDALVAENTFTNYLNEVARTDIDFPVVHADESAEAA